MFAVITGGSGSGKSDYAERLSQMLEPGKKLYLATMMVWDREGEERVARHRRMRAGKNFETVEVYTELEQFCLPKPFQPGDAVVLLECMSNLVCNEFYRQEKGAAERIMDGTCQLAGQCRHLIVVTNEVSADGRYYGEETERYRRLLGRINCFLGSRADLVVEAVYGIPVVRKGILP